MESKSIFLSVTFWGVIIGLASTALKKYGIVLDEAGLANDAVTLASALMAIYGRMRADQPVHIVPSVTPGNKEGGYVRPWYAPAFGLLMILFVVALIAAGLSACATTKGAESRLQQVSVADLDAAIASATAAGDDQAVQCFTLVKNFVGTEASPTEIKGVFSAFEATRLLRRRIDTGVPEPLHIACAPIIVDARITLLKLGLIAGGL